MTHTIGGIAQLIARPQVADIPGAVARGQQTAQRNVLFGQQQEERARQQQVRGLAGVALGQQLPENLQELAQADPDVALKVFDKIGVVGKARQDQFKSDIGVLSRLSTNPQLLSSQLDSIIQRNQAQGIDSSTLIQVKQDLANDPQGTIGEINQLNTALNPVVPSFKARELDIKQETLQVRREEIEQRRLDRRASLQLKKDQAEINKLDSDLKRETNELKRQELKAKSDQKKRDIQFEATNAVDTVQTSIELIERLTVGEGLESAAGISAAFPTLPGTQAADFEAQLETLKSQAFLTQVEKMKGLGALSENEGKKLGAAIGALDLSQSDKALRASLKRISETLAKAKLKLEKKFNVEAGLQQPPGPLGAGTPGQAQQIGRFVVEVE